MSKLIDLSHTVEDGLVTYKGLPAPVICDYLSREASKEIYAKGTTFQIGKIEMCSNTGTYLDSPFHRYENGKDLSELDLESVASLEAIKIVVPQTITAINKEYLEKLMYRVWLYSFKRIGPDIGIQSNTMRGTLILLRMLPNI